MIDERKINHVINFFKGLKHTRGKWAGKPFQLLQWQKQVLVDVFGTVRADGTRQYKTVWIEIPKKNGKSEFAAGLALYLAIADGEWGAEVYGAAADTKQASIIYRAAKAMVRSSPELLRRCEIIDSAKRIYIARTDSFYEVLSSEAYSKHGYNVHSVAFDEFHTQPNRELYDVLTKGSSAARSQPLFIFITTAGHDRHSICWELHQYARQVKDGVIKDPTWYSMIYALDEDEDWEDERNWYKVNPALGTILSIDEFRKSYNDAKRNVAEENVFRQFRLNQWVTSNVRWMRLSDWDLCGGKCEISEGTPCYAGLDLSSTTDLSALALVFPVDDLYYVMMRFWVPGDNAREKELRDRVPYSEWAHEGYITLTPGNVIDYNWIRKELRELSEKYNIKEIAYDRWGATKLIQDLIADGFTVVPFGQGYASMSPPTKELMNLILAQKIRHGDNPILRWNVDNMIVSQDAAGNIKPDKAKSTQRIDGAVALIMAIDRAIRHKSSLEDISIYEERGVLVL